MASRALTPVPRFWRHIRTQKVYEVIFEGLFGEDLGQVVAYVSTEGGRHRQTGVWLEPGVLWIQGRDSFREKFAPEWTMKRGAKQ